MDSILYKIFDNCRMPARILYIKVKSAIEGTGDGYILLTPENEYKNTNQKLKIQCPDGHIFYCAYQKFTRKENGIDKGTRCSDSSCIKKKIEQTNMERLCVKFSLQDPKYIMNI